MEPKDFENKMTTDSGEDFVRCLNCGAVIENQLIFKNNLPYIRCSKCRAELDVLSQMTHMQSIIDKNKSHNQNITANDIEDDMIYWRKAQKYK